MTVKTIHIFKGRFFSQLTCVPGRGLYWWWYWLYWFLLHCWNHLVQADFSPSHPLIITPVLSTVGNYSISKLAYDSNLQVLLMVSVRFC